MFTKVLLTQFGIPDLNTLAYRSNVHLAPGYLAGYAAKRFPNIEFVITPRIYTDLLTESAFVEYANSLRPDLIVFSLYLWNIEKSLRVVKKLKEQIPQATFLFGGPEVNPDNQFLLSSDHFTQGIVGEGEVPFCDYLAGKPVSTIAGYLTKTGYNDTSSPRTDYSPNTNPYLAGIIETKPDTTMFFETVRGCRFNCKFCYYSKVYKKPVPVGHDYLDAIFEYAGANHFQELFILDPSFNVQTGFDQLLDRLINLNSDHQFKVCTELRADFLSDGQIEKLVQLNLVEAEIGLQTTNPTALAAMGRRDKTQLTIEQTKKMMNAGIACKVDLIVGLPGDTLETFKRSADMVKKVEIHSGIQVFRLSILSGTGFSKQKEELGLTVQDKPPYYLESTPTFSADEIIEAVDYAEKVFDVSKYLVPPYLLSTNFDSLDDNDSGQIFVEFDSHIKPIHKLTFKASKTSHFTPHAIESNQQKLCESLVVHFEITDPKEQMSPTVQALDWLQKNHPNNNYQFILDFRCTPNMELVRKVARHKPKGDSHYLCHDSIANLGVDLNLTSSLAVIVPMTWHRSAEYASLKEQCDVFLHMTLLDEAFLQTEYDNHNFFFSGDAQEPAFAFLGKRDLLDEYTLFDDYRFERQKDVGNLTRMHRPHQLIF